VSAGDLERKARVAELLLGAARELGEGLEPERVYERFRELLVAVIPYDGLVISSYDPTEGLIRATTSGTKAMSSIPVLCRLYR
jgi:hypothetical protein